MVGSQEQVHRGGSLEGGSAFQVSCDRRLAGGSGAHLVPQGVVFSGRWSLGTKQQHINELELRAV